MTESTIKELPAAGTPRFTTLAAHRLWLIDHARALFDFFQVPSFNPAGGFFSLDENARPLSAKPGHMGANRQVHDTSRMVHCFAIAHLLGLPGTDRVVAVLGPALEGFASTPEFPEVEEAVASRARS
jgi:mannose/cellobiose epimerase-like protein (N-acyl-D-glucosamine 2-epimerase family)